MKKTKQNRKRKRNKNDPLDRARTAKKFKKANRIASNQNLRHGNTSKFHKNTPTEQLIEIPTRTLKGNLNERNFLFFS